MKDNLDQVVKDIRLLIAQECSNETLKARIEDYEEAKVGQYETIVMWSFTKIEVPKSGDYVWVCNARDKNSNLIKWGTGDETFYSYWDAF